MKLVLTQFSTATPLSAKIPLGTLFRILIPDTEGLLVSKTTPKLSDISG
jgi:hypothetical protein